LGIFRLSKSFESAILKDGPNMRAESQFERRSIGVRFT